MVKRTLAGALWFVTLNSGWSYVMLAWDLPRLPGLVLAALIATMIVADPLGLIWPRPAVEPARPAAFPTSAAPDIRSGASASGASAAR
jgi:hypothetical protein